jgi:WD40 repeat protein
MPRSIRIRFDATGSRLAVTGYPTEGGHSATILDLLGPPDADPVLISPNSEQVNDASFHPDGNWMAVDDRWQGGLWYLGHPRVQVLQGHPLDVLDVAFTPDGSRLVSCSADGDVRAWPLTPEAGHESRTIFHTKWVPPMSSGMSLLVKVAVDPRERFVVACGPGPVFQIPLDGGPARTLSGFEHLVLTIELSPDGRYLAGAGGSIMLRERHIRVWDLESDATFVLDAGDSVFTRDMAFDHSGRLWAAGDFGVRRWNVEEGTFEVVHEDTTRGIALSTDNRRMLRTDSRLRAFLGDLDSGHWEDLSVHSTLTWAGPPHARRGAAALDPTGTTAMISHPEGFQVVPSGGEPHLFVDPKLTAPGVASPDGKWIATGGHDGAVRLWPAPDLSKPPLHTLPYDQLLARLKGLTNIRMVPDENSDTGYDLDTDPFPGWETLPEH